MIRFHDEEDTRDEPVPGLPQPLPEGEQILWQGRPDTTAFLIHVVHIRVLIAWCVLATAWRLARLAATGAGADTLIAALGSATLLSALGLGVAIIIGWAMARSTLYTLTSQRIVLRYGAALRKYVNLPFTRIEAADLREVGAGKGNIALRIAPVPGLGYLRLWPHVRPLTFMRPQPMLRAVPDVRALAARLAEAMARAVPVEVSPLVPAPSVTPGRPSVPSTVAALS